MSPTQTKLTTMFIPLDGYGHINACIGVGQRLIAHGHRVIFVLDQAWKGTTTKRYPEFEEVYFVDKNRDPNFVANEYWIKIMDKLKESFSLDPIETLKLDSNELVEEILNVTLNVDDELKLIIEQIKPDLIVVDNYVTVPAIYNSEIPWVWMTSAAPLVCLPDPNLPPSRTGFPTNGDRKLWSEYMQLAGAKMKEINERLKKRLETMGVPEHPPGVTMLPSPYLNIYAYPEELDYLDIRPLPEKWQRFDHFIRLNENNSTFEIPKDFVDSPRGKLIYVSMGSMGCADLDLMRRLIDILSKSPNRIIFSLGPKHEQLTLADNMFGRKFVPQTQILPLVDLVITHGGNNTLLESLYFGKPLIVTPLFADQLGNAQRVMEVGLGYRFNPYKCDPEEFRQKIEDLLADNALAERLHKISKRMQNSNSTEMAATAIEAVVLQKNV